MSQRSPYLNKSVVCCCLLILLALLGAACNPMAAQPTSTPSETALPSNTPLPSPTSTPIPTDTPLPTDTATPTPVPTDTPTATITPNLVATRDAKATETQSALVAQVMADLESYEIPSEIAVNDGYLAFMQTEPVEITLWAYNQLFFAPLDEEMEFANFIIKTDVRWVSESGLAVCGLIFRSEPDMEKGAQYMFNTLRLSGAPAWDFEYWKYGQFDHNVLGEVKFSELIDLENGATNTYLLIIDGDEFIAFANNDRMGRAYSTKRIEGLIAYMGWQESGETTCTFENTWIWALP